MFEGEDLESDGGWGAGAIHVHHSIPPPPEFFFNFEAFWDNFAALVAVILDRFLASTL